MSFFKKLLGRETTTSQPRVRVCVECGMPIAEHKDWCSIWQHQQEMDRKATTAAAKSPSA